MHYANLIETATDVIYKTDKNGIITFMNGYGEEFTGYELKDIIGRHFTFFIRPDYLKRVAAYYIKKADTTRHYDALEFPVRLKNNTSRWVSQKVSVEKDDAGNPSGFYAIVRDITTLKKIEFEKLQIQKQYESLIESASDIIYKTDPDGNFIFFNKYTEKILGYRLEELIGRHFTSVIRKDFVKRVAWYYISNRDKVINYDTQEFPIVMKNGKDLWVSQKVTVERDADGSVRGFNSIVRDITLIKNVEFQKQERQQKIERFNLMLNELALKPHPKTERLTTSLQGIIEKAAEGLMVERVSIWNYNSFGIECRFLYEASARRHSSGGLIEREKFPVYFKAIETGREIVAPDVSRHPAVKELRGEYFLSTGIRSMLDLPIFVEGELQGVICFESVNSFKRWDTEDINFARAIANTISVSIETKKRKKAEKQLAFRSEILAAIAKTTEHLLVSEDVAGTLRDALPAIGIATRVNKVYYYEHDFTRKQLVLRHQWLSDNYPAPLAAHDLSAFPVDGLGPVSQVLLRKKCFISIVSELPPGHLKQMLSTHNVLSILMLPIFVKDTFYGFIGFDDCTIERVWTTDQMNVIRSLASNIANAIERVKNERVIRETEYNLRQINETIRDVFWLYDMQLQKYIYMSPSCEKLLGMTQEDFYAGKNYGDAMVVKEDLPKMRVAMQSLAYKPFYEVEYRIRHKDGTRWIYEKASAIHDPNGTLIRQAGTCSDITEKKLTQEKVTQLSLVAEKTTNGILIADRDGRTLWANEAYLRMFEIPENELIGRRPRDLFKTDENHVKTISRLNSSNYTLEFEVNTFKNNRKWVELTCTAIPGENGEVTHQVEVLSDITEKIRTRQELQEHLLDLEFQNVLKEKLISAGSIREITEKALGLIQQRMKSCIHISLLTLDEHKTHLNGYYLKGNVIEKESHPIKDIKSYEKIKGGKIFIENDLRNTDELSVSDHILLEYGAISYAVVPIMEEKEVTGMITITFNAPIHLNYAEKGNLVGFAYILSTTIRHLRLKNSLEEKNNDIEESLYYAQSIQKTILPDLRGGFPSLQNVVVFFKPRDIVSGDFYWAYENNEHLFIAIGDCTGHGVPGAFLTLIGNRILEQIVHLDGITTPSEILRRLDRQLYLSLSGGTSPDISDGMEIALCAINKPGKYLTFSGAGMGLLYFVNDTEHYIKGMLTSIGENRKEGLSLPDHRVALEENQCFYMASDGYQDQLGGAHFKRFSKQKLISLLSEVKDMDAKQQEDKLDAVLTEYMGSNHQTDDISLIGFKIK